MNSPLQIQFVGARPGLNGAAEPVLVGGSQLDLQSFRDLAGHTVLHLEDVVERRVYLGAPKGLTPLGPDELHGHAQARARALKAAVDDGIDSERTPRFLRSGGAVAI